jgi:hypothetical protein
LVNTNKRTEISIATRQKEILCEVNEILVNGNSTGSVAPTININQKVDPQEIYDNLLVNTNELSDLSLTEISHQDLLGGEVNNISAYRQSRSSPIINKYQKKVDPIIKKKMSLSMNSKKGTDLSLIDIVTMNKLHDEIVNIFANNQSIAVPIINKTKKVDPVDDILTNKQSVAVPTNNKKIQKFDPVYVFNNCQSSAVPTNNQIKKFDLVDDILTNRQFRQRIAVPLIKPIQKVDRVDDILTNRQRIAVPIIKPIQKVDRVDDILTNSPSISCLKCLKYLGPFSRFGFLREPNGVQYNFVLQPQDIFGFERNESRVTKEEGERFPIIRCLSCAEEIGIKFFNSYLASRKEKLLFGTHTLRKQDKWADQINKKEFSKFRRFTMNDFK